MPIHPDMTGRAVERARWLAELALALAEASRLSRALAAAGLDDCEARALHGNIDQLRAEIDCIRRARGVAGANHPKRM